jgi:Mg-chelatase subunit ChlD
VPADDAVPPDEVPVVTTVAPGDPAEALRAAHQPLDGWQLASRLTAGRLRTSDATAIDYAERLAAAAVLRRASALVGPLRAATRLERGPAGEAHDGELDLETTLENVAGKPRPDPGDWVMERRVEQRRQVVLIIDMSGSMAGENMALAAVAAAVLALKAHAGDLGVVGFADEARVVVPLGEALAEREMIRRLLDRPCRGATNIAAALELGGDELGRARNPRRAAVLITDGMATAGPDPRPVAARFPALHVLHTKPGEHTRLPTTVWISPRYEVGEDVARLGHGRLVPVAEFRELPRRMLELADLVLR